MLLHIKQNKNYKKTKKKQEDLKNKN